MLRLWEDKIWAPTIFSITSQHHFIFPLEKTSLSCCKMIPTVQDSILYDYPGSGLNEEECLSCNVPWYFKLGEVSNHMRSIFSDIFQPQIWVRFFVPLGRVVPFILSLMQILVFFKGLFHLSL
jgi:hypothetical protein